MCSLPYFLFYSLSYSLEEVLKSLPIFQLDSLLSIILEIQSIRVDSYILPAKPVLQIPYQATSTEPIRFTLVYDHKHNDLPNGILLCDLSLPYLYCDIVDTHWITLFQSISSIVSLSSYYLQLQPSSQPLLHLLSPSSSLSYFYIGYCSIHPIYFLFSLESNTYVSLSFQNTPLRFKIKPFTKVTGRIEDYLRVISNSIISSALLQSPAFVGTLDLLGNPANLIISIYHNLIDIIANPVNSVFLPSYAYDL